MKTRIVKSFVVGLIAIFATQAFATGDAEIQARLDAEAQSLQGTANDLNSFSGNVREHALAEVANVISNAFATVELVKESKNPLQFKDTLSEIADIIGYQLPMTTHKLDVPVFKGFMSQLFDAFERNTADHFAKNLSTVQKYGIYKKLDAHGMRELLERAAKRDPVIEFDRSVSRRLRYTMSVLTQSEVRSKKWRRVALRGASVIATGLGAFALAHDWSAVWTGGSLLAGILTFVEAQYPGLLQGLAHGDLLEEARARSQSDFEQTVVQSMTDCAVLLARQSETP